MSPPVTTDPGRIVAHRGASRVAPENTLAAFRAARDQGARWVEFDVTLLGDGFPVIHHDATLDRCTTGRGPILSLRREDLARIDAGAPFSDGFRGEPPPGLEAALDLLEDLELFANVELKPNDGDPVRLAQAAADAVRGRPWAEDRLLVSSFDFRALRAFRALRPAQPLAVLWARLPTDWRAAARALDACGVHMDYRNLDMRILDEVRGAGLDLRVYPVKDPGPVAPFRDAGLTGAITDHPPLFLNDPHWRAWAEA